jgi:hypothetical protein
MKLTHLLIAAAASGVMLGVSGCGSRDDSTPAAAATDTGDKHACKGLNSCKAKGSCKTDAHSCKGQNDCKGQGGCATAKHDCKGKNDCKGLGAGGTNACKGQGACKVTGPN